MKRDVVVLLFAAAVLAACETPPKPPPAPAPPPGINAAPPVPSPVVLRPFVSPESALQAQKTAMVAVEMLESGNEEGAKNEIKRALALDWKNPLALSLADQISVDPFVKLGRDSFPYTLRQGETLSIVAKRYLGDLYLFYLLARYNGIAIPKQVSTGQVLRIPGKVPPLPSSPPPQPQPQPLPRLGKVERKPAVPPSVATPASAAQSALPPPSSPPPPPTTPLPPPPPPPPPPEPTPGERAMRNGANAERSGDFAKARAEYRAAANMGQSGAAAKAEEMRAKLVQRHTSSARSCLSRQDLNCSIENWQRVVDLDPGNTSAKSELGRVRELNEKLKTK